jgi:hypothetical protein
MPGKTVLASTSAALILLPTLLLFSGCDRNYRQIVIVENGKAEYVTVGRGPKRNPKIWKPGRVLAFRTTSTVPDAPGNVTGKAGHVYRIGDDMKLEEVAEFQGTVPSDSLAYTYGK